MKKLFLLLILSFFSAQGLAGGCPDGSEPVKSVSADGTYFVYNCGGQASSSTANSSNVNSNTKALAGIDIENDPNIDFFKPPTKPYPTGKLYYWVGRWQMADFNNDGYSDALYIGVMNPNNINWVGEDASGICGGGECKGEKPLPILFLGDAKHKLTYAPELLIDNREDSGMSLGRQLLVADYNNDNILDFYVADTGVGTYDGLRDSYFLSQPNGTWLESSKTHLSHSNFVVFNHGAATGDIDNDGDMDVVITGADMAKGSAFWCWFNDGTGFLNKRQCGGIIAFGLELADMDGDGDLDALLGAHEINKYLNFTGVVWNDGRGNFPKNNTTPLPQHKKKWSTIPEVSAADLDNDGDLDIVYSRAGELYVGTAIQIIENLGNKKFKDHGIFPLVEAPADFIPTHEGNEWNDFIESIRFRDLDKDGDIDLYLSSGSQKTDGMVLLNQGDFNFELLLPQSTKIVDGIVVTKTPVSEEQTAEEQAMKEELAAEVADAIAKRKAEVAAGKAKRDAEERRILEEETAKLLAEIKAKRIAEEVAKAEENKSSPLFDGRYSFTISRYNENDGSQRLGNGYIEINNGIMTVAKEGRTLDTGSIDLYDSFEGQIDKKGNIMSSLKIPVLFGVDSTPSVDLNGSIDSQLQGKWDHYFDVILKLGKKE